MMTTAPIPTTTTDPINDAILRVSEDQIQGFNADPIGEIARLSGIDVGTVIERLRAMLAAGTIRRIRQTLMSVNLAPGALVAWSVPEDKLSAAFDWMFQNDPFSGHVVIRSTDAAITGSKYRLWTTLKVPVGFSMQKHCEFLMQKTGATHFRAMPANKLFVLGVGHVRRRGMEPGSRSDAPAEAQDTAVVELSELEWRVLLPLKREFEPHEIVEDIWRARAAEAGVSLEEFVAVAKQLNERRVIGRFSTFLEHVKPNAAGERVTKFNALFHWAVPPGREMEAGREVGRHHIMTHAYWREEAGIPVSYTNVFWGGRSEIKPSEIAPQEYVAFCQRMNIGPGTMRG
jgi:hypothetical protein